MIAPSRRTALTLLGLGGLGLLNGPASAQPAKPCRADVDANGHTLFNLGELDMIDDPVIETTDGSPLELRLNGERVLRLEPTPGRSAANILGGHPSNTVDTDVEGATISGGGSDDPEGASRPNQVLADFGTVAGGLGNEASGLGSTVGGGRDNTASGTFAEIGGGTGNEANDFGATIGGGFNNTASGDGPGADTATIGGGRNNEVSNSQATVGGGRLNTPSGVQSTISGGQRNETSGRGATIGGGDHNVASDEFTTIGGGGSLDPEEGNIASGEGATVGGSIKNTASESRATVGGGAFNTASGIRAAVGGGQANQATEDVFTVAGGVGNRAGEAATIGGGINNEAVGDTTTVSGGFNNKASGGLSTIGGGRSNEVSGSFAAVPGGRDNRASGDYSFATGRQAIAESDGGDPHHGAVVFGDSSDRDVRADRDDQFVVQAGGGAVIYSSSDLSEGVELPAGSGSWSSLSTRTMKTNIEPANVRSVLDEVERLTISTWQYDSEEGATHLGPMAEDFHAAFELGDSEDRISTVDADGVALAAIQGLSEKLEETIEELERKDERIDVLESAQAELLDRLTELEAHAGVTHVAA